MTGSIKAIPDKTHVRSLVRVAEIHKLLNQGRVGIGIPIQIIWPHERIRTFTRSWPHWGERLRTCVSLQGECFDRLTLTFHLQDLKVAGMAEPHGALCLCNEFGQRKKCFCIIMLLPVSHFDSPSNRGSLSDPGSLIRLGIKR